jgi:hypothetical protein
MYLRHTTVRKNGKTHTYWRLVRSVRSGTKVCQHTVAQLGELDAEGRVRAQALAKSIAGVECQPGLFEEPTSAQPVRVVLHELRLERGRRFGDVWLAWRLWQAVQFDRLLHELLPRGREEVPWASMAAVLVIARLCEPSSELHIAEDWFRRTALGDLLGIAQDKVNEDRLYRALDQLLPYKANLEAHLKDRLGSLFGLAYDLLLYDITSTYFEGQATANTLAQRGYSRDHRPDCKQVLIGLVVSREGYPLGYETFAGNRNDGTTVQEVVTSLEQRYGHDNRIWVLDRGMVSAKTLTWLRQRDSRYLVGTPKSLLKQFADAVQTGAWEEVRPGLQVQRCASADGTEVFILCRSASKQGWPKHRRPVLDGTWTPAWSSDGSVGCWGRTAAPQACSPSPSAVAKAAGPRCPGLVRMRPKRGRRPARAVTCYAAMSRTGRRSNCGRPTCS